MKNTLLVKIILPSATLLSADARLINLPGEEGMFGVLPEHCKIISNLDNGIISIFLEDHEQKYFVYNAIAQVTNEGLNILCEFAVDLATETKTSVMDHIVALDFSHLDPVNDALQIGIIQDRLKKYQELLKFL